MGLARGPIDGIAFLTSSDNQQPADTASVVELWLGHTSKTIFDDKCDFIPESMMVKVFDGRMNHSCTPDTWDEVMFDTPFDYDGESNLVVYMKQKSGYHLTSYRIWYNVNSQVNFSTLRAFSDSAPFTLNEAIADTTHNNVLGATRPVMKLHVNGTKFYGIWIGNTRVSSDNVANVTDENLTRGTVTFDTITNTLTLNNIYLESNISAYNREEDLNIVFQGDNVIEEHIYPTRLGTTTIEGGDNDNLQVSFIEAEAHLEDQEAYTTLVLKNGNFNINGSGVYGMGDIYEDLVIEAANISSVDTNEYAAIGYWNDITLTDCQIVYPVGATIEDGFITLSSEPCDSVRIERTEVGFEIATEKEFVIAPNPAVDVVEFHGIALTENARVSVYNADGRLVAGVEVPAQDHLTMNVTTLPAGIYTVQVISGNTRYTAKLVKK